MKQTIEHLQNDVILGTHKSSGKSSSSSTQHNLFQTFRVSVRMFSLTVLHYDPIYSNAHARSRTSSRPAGGTSSTTSSQSNLNNNNSNTRRFIVERIKPTCDAYFDFVSTIDTSNVTTSSGSGGGAGGSLSQTIDKSIVAKYHQACALNDHFLVLLKPLNFNLVQKINQRQLGDETETSIHYSLNDMTLTVGYMQVNEYLLAENSLDKWEATMKSTSSSSSSSSRKARQQAQILEISQAASVVELITFQDLGTNTSQMEQPCVKIQLTVYDPLDVISPAKLASRAFTRRGSAGARQNELNRMLSRSFENVSVQLNHCLSFELDISLVDRLYYIINDVSKPTFSNTANSTNAFGSSRQNNKNKTTKVSISLSLSLLIMYGFKNYVLIKYSFLGIICNFT